MPPRKASMVLSPDQQVFLDKAVARLVEAKENGSIISDTYCREYKRFVIWVIQNCLMPNAEQYPFRFITRSTVDSYYLNAVSKREFGTKNSLSRVRSSLQKVWDEVERRKLPSETTSPLMDGEYHSFAVESDAVKEAEKEQQRYYNTIKGDKFSGTDPFKGLKADLLTTKDKKKLMTYVLNSRLDWKDVGCCFNWGCNGGVRGDSTRSLRLQDLYVSYGFAPGQGRSLTIILKKDDQKVHFATDRLVGVLRHREYLLCAAFMTAMNVIRNLQQMGSKVHFRRHDKKMPAEFWGISFVDFEKLSDEENAMNEIYKATGIESCKVTHHRTHCVMHASTEGLQQYQVSTLTKHMNDKLTKSYWAEMERPTMTVMAGFAMDEAYFVPRTQIGLPCPVDECINRLFPQDYSRWKSEQESEEGDKSECAKKFFSRLLPYLVEVLLQDGIYLIRDFPNHEMSLMLNNAIPNYATWAAQKRKWVENELITFEPRKIEALNEASQRAFEILSTQMGALQEGLEMSERSNRFLREEVYALRQELRDQHQELRSLQATRDNEMKQVSQEIRNHLQGILARLPPTGGSIQESQQLHQQLEEVHQVTLEVRGVTQIPTTTARKAGPQARNTEQRGSVFHLQSRPYQPALSRSFAKNWPDVLHVWKTNKLHEFISSDKSKWENDNNVKVFNKYHRAYRCIKLAQDTKGLSAEEAAKVLDQDRGMRKMSMTAHLAMKALEHPDIKSRKSHSKKQATNRKRAAEAERSSTGNRPTKRPKRAPAASNNSSSNNSASHRTTNNNATIDAAALTNPAARNAASRHNERAKKTASFVAAAKKNTSQTTGQTSSNNNKQAAHVPTRGNPAGIGPRGLEVIANVRNAQIRALAGPRTGTAMQVFTPAEHLTYANAIHGLRDRIHNSAAATVDRRQQQRQQQVDQRQQQRQQHFPDEHRCPVPNCNGGRYGLGTGMPDHVCHNTKSSRPCSKRVHGECTAREGFFLGNDESKRFCSRECMNLYQQ